MNRGPGPSGRRFPIPAKRARSLVLLASLALASCSRPTVVPVPGETPQVGIASWYGGKFHGRRTSSGEVFDMNDMTAAHPSLPFGTLVQVTNLENGRAATVRINDRGPFVRGRIIDLSYAAARVLGIVGPGTARVRIEVEKGAPERDRTSRVSVQVGAFVVQENAYAMKRELEKIIAGVYISAARTGGRTFYRVRVAARDREEAGRIARRLADRGFPVIVVEE
jgi:rare lipoprotein A